MVNDFVIFGGLALVFIAFMWSLTRHTYRLPFFKLTWYLDSMEEDILQRMTELGVIEGKNYVNLTLRVGDLIFTVPYVNNDCEYFPVDGRLYYQEERILISRPLSVLLQKEAERKYYKREWERQVKINEEQKLRKDKLKVELKGINNE